MIEMGLTSEECPNCKNEISHQEIFEEILPSHEGTFPCPNCELTIYAKFDYEIIQFTII